MSSQQQDLVTNPYRPLLDKSNDYVGVLPQDISLEFKMDKMPSRSYDWSFVATGIYFNTSKCSINVETWMFFFVSNFIFVSRR
jgi:hypothetical protein